MGIRDAFRPRSVRFPIRGLKTQTKAHRTIILPVVFRRYETWLLTMREEQRLSAFENMVLKNTSGHHRKEVTGDWKNNCAVKTSRSALMIRSKMMRWAGHVVRVSEKRNAQRIIMGTPEERDYLAHTRVDEKIPLK